jgi:hypothetical protein
LEFNEQNVPGKSLVYALIGDPIDHSMSPIIQNAAFRSADLRARFFFLSHIMIQYPFAERKSANQDPIRRAPPTMVATAMCQSPYRWP